MERLTDKHFNELLGYYMKCSGCCERSIACNECEEFESLVDRLGIIEEILGDNYDLDRLRNLVKDDRDRRCVVYQSGHPVVSYCYRDDDGVYIREVSGLVVHEAPILKIRPERYERYDEYGLNENGEMLYVRRILIDEKSYAMYCPACGRRLCSRFTNYCPSCGAKMDR